MASALLPDHLRPLPARPNLEFEKKRAKKLVKEKAGSIKLAEAQLLIAREYGFASWRKLQAYYNTWQAHDRAGADGTPQSRIDLERSVRELLAEFATRHLMSVQPPDTRGTGAAIAAYVPRFYGFTDQEIFSSTITEMEAQLVVARRSRFPDWKTACEFAALQPAVRSSEPQRTPPSLAAANRAVHEGDVGHLAQLFHENPEWIVTPDSSTQLHGLAWDIIRMVARSRSPQALSLFGVLAAVGVDVQAYLNLALLGFVIPKMTTQEVQGLLEMGADPNWKPRNGFSVLEHAIIRYGNGDAVDLIAKRVTPRKAFWVAAGIGDVRTMLQFVNKHCAPNDAARQDRPDAGILGTGGTVRPDASDREVVWEAFMMAALNGRSNTMQALLDRGFPVDYTPVWYNALHASVSYRLERSVEFLLANGADPDFRAWPDQKSPRELAVTQHDYLPNDSAAQRIHALILTWEKK
ncbi:MAG: ankyrin repeat domain-containing protein [Gemmatimonadaceae bacterium]